MNDTELENLLCSMSPAAPRAELVSRVDHDLKLLAAFRDARQEVPVMRRQPARWLANVTWAGLGAAAAVVVLGLMQQPAAKTSGDMAASPLASANAILPVSSTREWVGVEDMGISFATPDSPAHRMKVRSMESFQWIDPKDGAEYTVEVPQEESIALPVKFQ